MENDLPPPSAPEKSQRAVNIASVVLALIVACACIHIVRVYVLTAEQDFVVLYYAAFIPARYMQSTTLLTIESFTSPITYSLLHVSFSHLLNNCLWLAVFGSPLANTIGVVRFLLFWVVCVVIAALFHYAGQPNDISPMMGASGAIAGMMGAAARFGFAMNRQEGGSSFNPILPPLRYILRNRNVITFLAVYLISNFLIGASNYTSGGAAIAWQAHIGGVITGFLLIPLFLGSRKSA